MSVRRPAKSRAEAPPAPKATVPVRPRPRQRDAVARPTVVRPRSLEEAEDRYVVVRDAWTAAMRRCSSGRAADLASLAIAQEAYELASAEVVRWRSGVRVAVPVVRDAPRTGLEVAIGQEMAWRRVHEHQEETPRPLLRLIRRLTGRR
jgi:hypothetical protein